MERYLSGDYVGEGLVVIFFLLLVVRPFGSNGGCGVGSEYFFFFFFRLSIRRVGGSEVAAVVSERTEPPVNFFGPLRTGGTHIREAHTGGGKHGPLRSGSRPRGPSFNAPSGANHNGAPASTSERSRAASPVCMYCT